MQSTTIRPMKAASGTGGYAQCAAANGEIALLALVVAAVVAMLPPVRPAN
ncbi:hypothetical protein [uncultured Herbaspirillum sp.]|nr:hypothetical protein [uncultured Herbaspirillum sp.]